MKGKVFFKAIVSLMCVFSMAGCASTQKAGQVYDGIKGVNDFIGVLENNPNGVFANRSGGHLRTQIITYQFIIENRVYFCTGSEKPFYGQILKFPYVSFCTFPNDFEPVLSLNGKVVFSDDITLKERVINGSSYGSQFIKRHYQTADNPNLKLYYIDVEEIEVYDKNGAKIYKTS